MPLVGRGSQTAGENKASSSRFVAQLYISRRKVWEGRASSQDEANNLAKQEKAKYPGARSSIVIKEAKGSDA